MRNWDRLRTIWKREREREREREKGESKWKSEKMFWYIHEEKKERMMIVYDDEMQ